jgi:hypothetical protein
MSDVLRMSDDSVTINFFNGCKVLGVCTTLPDEIIARLTEKKLRRVEIFNSINHPKYKAGAEILHRPCLKINLNYGLGVGKIVPPTLPREAVMSERRMAVAPGLIVLLNSISFSRLPASVTPPRLL